MLNFINDTLGIIVSVITLFGIVGAGVLTVGHSKRKIKIKNSNVDSGNNSGNKDSIIININGDGNKLFDSKPSQIDDKQQTQDIKSSVQILFIDDEDFNVVKMLKKAGWRNIKRKPDFSNLDDIDLQNADVVFVDIKGVGIVGGYKNEGIGLAAAIKKKYPRKGVIIYSGTHEHDIFSSELDSVDAKLPKNAEPIQFSYLIEQYGAKAD